MNRFGENAATQAELADKLTLIRAIGGTIEDGSMRLAAGVMNFKVLMDNTQLETYRMARQLPVN